MDILYIVLSAAGVITSFILIVYLFWVGKGNPLANKLLGILFLFLTIRIGKATLYYFFDLNALAVYVGLSAFLGIGPATYLYVKVVLRNHQALRPIYYIHFALPLGILVTGFLSSPQTLSYLQSHLYSFVLVYLLIYLVLSFYLVLENIKPEPNIIREKRSRFLWQLLGAIALIYAVYAINWFINFDIYIYGGLFYTVIIYLFIYKFLVDKNLNHELGKSNKLQYINEEAVDVGKKRAEITHILNEDKLYLHHDLNIDTLAEAVKLTKHQLSELINMNLGQGFPAFINTYRLEHAKKLLIETSLNVSEIAYDSGFNSISTFNTLFKKKIGMTPSQFRKK